jgi:OOP family OmpA-OmpF porin
MRSPMRVAFSLWKQGCPIAVALATTAASSPALAEAPSVDLRGYHASVDAAAGNTLEPSSAPDTGEWNVGLRLHYAHRPVELRSSGTRGEIVPIRHQVGADFVAAVGLWRRVLLGMDLPYVLGQTGDPITDPGLRAALGVRSADAVPLVALGDLGLSGKIVIMPAEEPEFGGFGMALLQRFGLPTGDEGSWIAEGDATSETRALAEWRSAPLSALLSGGIKFRFEKERFLCNPASAETPRSCPVELGTELPAAVGLVFRPSGAGIDDGGRTSLYAEARTYLPLSPVGPFEREEPAGAFASTGVRVAVRDVSFYGGVEFGLIDGVGNAPVRASIGIDFAPRDHDKDDDRIEDDRDQCRELPEDRDGYEDDDGCPEVDDDQDGVPDAEDACPRDHAPNTRDGCPAEGHHFVPDVEDRCPEIPRPNDDGCPEPAAAPPVPPVLRQPEPPVDDVDADTFAAADDKCPTEAETFDGKDDDDGCPEPPGVPPRKPLVEVAAGTLTPNGMLAFDKDDAVENGSKPLLRAIAAEVKKAPGSKLLVGARPSPARKDQAQKRSFAVAQAVRAYVGREDAVEVVEWDRVKGAPRADVYGVGLVLGR